MKIKKISARNFRTLQDIDVNFQDNYSAISGKNNCGKSAIVKVIEFFFSQRDDENWFPGSNKDLIFGRDFTQWASNDKIELSVTIELNKVNDSELWFVVESFSKIQYDSEILEIDIVYSIDKDEKIHIASKINDTIIDSQPSNEILKKFRSAYNIIVHNSTASQPRSFMSFAGFTEVLETQFSQTDQFKISDIHEKLKKAISSATKDHKQKLDKLIGRLSDQFTVELSPLDRPRNNSYPLEVKLIDKSVKVPLAEWGAGTQNRTRVLMSILGVIRQREMVSAENRSTPVFIVEEPESFLHPSAQAEFGSILNTLATELDIQIIATTHSPYMLNQSQPAANILLERRVEKNKPKGTFVVAVDADQWMVPFANVLGVVPTEFESWKPLFNSRASNVILVEGEIDKKYLEIFAQKYPKHWQIPSSYEIVSYGGKDALKNTDVLKFIMRRLGKVVITYDLDAENDVKPALERMGLVKGKDFVEVGLDKAGKRCIEGLIDESLHSAVYQENPDLIAALQSNVGKEKNDAKGLLKAKLVQQFADNTLMDGCLKELIEFTKKLAKLTKQ